uniref:Protein Vpu n=1 Tax=Human immunodeficiency virus type 1 TaxID=11676 RepID=B0YP76_HV1|nr:vpu protein [Human immunodeficiency virus 1]
MQSLEIYSIVALVVVAIIVIVVWSIVFIEYKKLLRIDRLIDRIRERAEDSGNESEGDQEELLGLVEMGHDAPWDVNDL